MSSLKAKRARPLMTAASVASLGAASIALIGADEARAQDTNQSQVAGPAADSSTALNAIVVTARRTEENLMTVPLAITALTADDIEEQGIANLTDIANVAPSFHFTQGTGGGSGRNDRSSRQLTFRGLSIANGVMFIDGAPVTDANPPPISEVERIEILKGPQSVYFGRSTFMGAMNFVTKDPSRDFEGRLVADYGSFNSNELLLSVEGPIAGDVLRGRLSGSHVFRGAQYDNAGDYTQGLGQQESNSLTGSLLFEPNNQLTVKAYASYLVHRDGPPAQIMLGADEFNCNLGGTRGDYYCGTLPDVSDLPEGVISGNYEMTPYMYEQIIDNAQGLVTIFDPEFLTSGGLKRRGVQAHVRADYEFGAGFTLSSLTAYHSNKHQVILDMLFRDRRDEVNPRYPDQPLPHPTWLLMSQHKGWDVSQELRLTSPQDRPLRGTVGANYMRAEDRSTLYGVKWSGTASSGTPSRDYPQTYAVFGGLYYDLSNDITVSAEARYQWDNIKSAQIGYSTGYPRNPPLEFEETFTSFSPRFIIDYEFAQDSTIYALFSRAYSPGGFNTGLAGQPQYVLDQLASVGLDETYDQEKIDNFEIGLKSTFADGRGRMTLALYYDKWRDGQISTSVPFQTELGQTNLLTITQNLGSVDLKGVEFEMDFAVTRNLTLSGTFGLNDSNIKVYTCGDCLSIYGSTDATGNRLGQAPKYKGTFSADYVATLIDDVDWFVRSDYSYRGKYFITSGNVANTSPQHLVNLRAGIRNDFYSLELYARNLLDDDSLRGSLGLNVDPAHFLENQIRTALPDRRTFGVRASVNF